MEVVQVHVKETEEAKLQQAVLLLVEEGKNDMQVGQEDIQVGQDGQGNRQAQVGQDRQAPHNLQLLQLVAV